MPTVIILTGQSLFAEGVASRLRQYPQEVDVRVLDPNDPNALDLVSQHISATVIMDANDSEAMQLCPLSRLMFANPEIKVVRLDSQRNTIQVVSSEQHQAGKIHDLLGIIQQP
jgi:DNA-binding NarL/FixJ family response regulator